jgi:hypothetical protein
VNVLAVMFKTIRTLSVSLELSLYFVSDSCGVSAPTYRMPLHECFVEKLGEHTQTFGAECRVSSFLSGEDAVSLCRNFS